MADNTVFDNATTCNIFSLNSSISELRGCLFSHYVAANLKQDVALYHASHSADYVMWNS